MARTSATLTPPVSHHAGLSLCSVYRTRDPRQIGLVLVQMKHGLWGLMSEPVSPLRSTRSVASVVPTTTTTPASQCGRMLSALLDDSRNIVKRTEIKTPGQEREDDGTSTREDGNTTSSLFYAWPPLSSCVVEQYSHHVLSRTRAKVICLADSGVLDTYLFGPAKGEARKTKSRKVDLHANGATATCMCLLPDTPACVVAALDRCLASHTPVNAAADSPTPGDDADEWGDNKNNRDRPCGGIGGRSKASQVVGEKHDQVVAIGTSHGGVILVETVVNGTVSREHRDAGRKRGALEPGRRREETSPSMFFFGDNFKREKQWYYSTNCRCINNSSDAQAFCVGFNALLQPDFYNTKLIFLLFD